MAKKQGCFFASRSRAAMPRTRRFVWGGVLCCDNKDNGKMSPLSAARPKTSRSEPCWGLFTPRLAALLSPMCIEKQCRIGKWSQSVFSALSYLHCTKGTRVGQRSKHNAAISSKANAASAGVKRAHYVLASSWSPIATVQLPANVAPLFFAITLSTKCSLKHINYTSAVYFRSNLVDERLPKALVDSARLLPPF